MRSIMTREAYWQDILQQRYFCIAEDDHLQIGTKSATIHDAETWLAGTLRIRWHQNGAGLGVIYDRLTDTIIGAYEWQSGEALQRVSSDILLLDNIKHLSLQEWPDQKTQ